MGVKERGCARIGDNVWVGLGFEIGRAGASVRNREGIREQGGWIGHSETGWVGLGHRGTVGLLGHRGATGGVVRVQGKWGC